MQIFDESTLRKLEQLSLVASRVRVGVMKGDRRSRKRGTSIEFADYRNYTRGDDLRRLDWNVYARLERPFIKLLEEEEDLAVHLLVDTSASMNWPDKDGAAAENKLLYALRLAAALGLISLSSSDLLGVSLLKSQGSQRWGPHRGRQHGLRLLQFLESTTAQGTTNLDHSLRDYAQRARRPGLLFLITDLLSPAGYQEGLSALQARGYEIALLHLLSPDEVDPPLAGDLKLVDVETGQDAELSLDASTVYLYQQRLQGWKAEIAAYCGKRNLHYIPVTTHLPWETLVLQSLRARGLVK